MGSLTSEGCLPQYSSLCWVHASASGGSIFAFSDFLSAAAILMVMYTISDARYRFRLSVAPFNLFAVGFRTMVCIGGVSLALQLWFGENWPIPRFLNSLDILQAILAAVFSTIVVVWVRFAFIKPSTFSHSNSHHFSVEVTRRVARGADDELRMLADELGRSANSIVKLSLSGDERDRGLENFNIYGYENRGVAEDAYRILLLIGNRKLCRHIVSSSPLTAMEIFNAAKEHGRNIPALGAFSRAIAAEALINRDSFLYLEEGGKGWDLLARWQPITTSIYGNYDLIAALNHMSPLDIPLELRWALKADQLKAYCGAILTTLKSYLQQSRHRELYQLRSAFEIVHGATSDLHELGDQKAPHTTDQYHRLRVAMRFLLDAAELVDKQASPPIFLKRKSSSRQHAHQDVYDLIADTIYEIIAHARLLTSPDWNTWNVYYSCIWSDVSHHGGQAMTFVRKRLKRRLWEDVKEFVSLPNYYNASILGYCLDVMGLERRRRGSDFDGLHRLCLFVAKKYFLSVMARHPRYAQAVLVHELGFDEETSRLYRTYNKLAEQESRVFLDLDPVASVTST